MPRLSIPLTQPQLTAVKVKAAQASLSMAEVSRQLLFAWLADEVLTKRDIDDLGMCVNGILASAQLKDEYTSKLYDLIDKLDQMKKWVIE